MPQSARCLRLSSQLGSQRQQSSVGLPVPQEKYPSFLLSVLLRMAISTMATASSGFSTACSFTWSTSSELAAIDELLEL
uniref:Uncharacterized protein n=1 Tax=Rhizophora mucronata TaxID=61149 RepID=A0A2P2QUX6_RHIMU